VYKWPKSLLTAEAIFIIPEPGRFLLDSLFAAIKSNDGDVIQNPPPFHEQLPDPTLLDTKKAMELASL
jgi:hypothetical protein